MRYTEVKLAGTVYKASYFTFDQALEIRDALLEIGAGDMRRQIAGNCAIVAAGLAEHHPEMTSEAIAKLRGPLTDLVSATRAVLAFNEYDFGGDAGKGPAAETT